MRWFYFAEKGKFNIFILPTWLIFFFTSHCKIKSQQKHRHNFKGGCVMSVKTRLLALNLLEKQKREPEYAKQIGIEVNVVNKKDIKKVTKSKNKIMEV